MIQIQIDNHRELVRREKGAFVGWIAECIDSMGFIDLNEKVETEIIEKIQNGLTAQKFRATVSAETILDQNGNESRVIQVNFQNLEQDMAKILGQTLHAEGVQSSIMARPKTPNRNRTVARAA